MMETTTEASGFLSSSVSHVNDAFDSAYDDTMTGVSSICRKIVLTDYFRFCAQPTTSEEGDSASSTAAVAVTTPSSHQQKRLVAYDRLLVPPSARTKRQLVDTMGDSDDEYSAERGALVGGSTRRQAPFSGEAAVAYTNGTANIRRPVRALAY